MEVLNEIYRWKFYNFGGYDGLRKIVDWLDRRNEGGIAV